MTLVVNPFGEVSYYEYAECGQVAKRTLGNGCISYYEYDIKDRVSRIDHRTSDLTQIAELQYQYDKVGNPTCIVREDGSATYYEYDKVYQLTARRRRTAANDGQRRRTTATAIAMAAARAAWATTPPTNC